MKLKFANKERRRASTSLGLAWSENECAGVRSLSRGSGRADPMKWKLIVGLTLLLIGATSAWSQQTSSALSADELAKELSTPVPSLWSLQFQFNNARLETGDSNPVSG